MQSVMHEDIIDVQEFDYIEDEYDDTHALSPLHKTKEISKKRTRHMMNADMYRKGKTKPKHNRHSLRDMEFLED